MEEAVEEGGSQQLGSDEAVMRRSDVAAEHTGSQSLQSHTLSIV